MNILIKFSMRYMKLKTKKSYFSKMKVILLITIFVIITLFFALKNIMINITNIILDYAEAESERLITEIINNSSPKDVFDKLTLENLYTITKNKQNEIEMLDYNVLIVNEFLDKVTDNIQTNLKNMEDKVLLKIPIGIATDNPIFNNLGPKIPMKLKLISSVLTNVNTSLKPYGINNCLIEISVNIEVRAKIILPVISKNIIITNDIPISYKLINGKIPSYYGYGIEKNSNEYSLPLE